VYANPGVIAVGLLYAIIGLFYIVQTTFMVSFMLEQGVGATHAGQLVALMGVLAIFSAPGWGWLSDRLGHGSTLVLGMVLAVVAMGIPLLWPAPAGFGIHYLLMGGTVTGLFTLILTAAAEQVAPADTALAVSFVTVFFAVGQLVGPAAAGWMVDRTGAFAPVFWIICAILVAGVLLSVRIRTLGAQKALHRRRLEREQRSEVHP
jgi:MFS family permease